MLHALRAAPVGSPRMLCARGVGVSTRTPLAPGWAVLPPRGVRALASKRPEEEKSWGEIANDAATVLGGALTKLGKSALGALGGLLEGGGDASSKPGPPRRTSSPPPPRRPRPGDEGDGDIFSWPGRGGGGGGGGPLSQSGGGGPLANPLGGLIGGLLGRAVAGVAGALASQAAEAGELKERALAACQSDAAVRDSFGGSVRAVPGPTSQAGSTSIINGRTQKRLTISFAVSGPRGTGVVQATSVGGGDDGGGGGAPPAVSVRGPDGRVISVKGGGGGNGGGWFGGGGGGGRRAGSFGRAGSGEVIDVDFKEL